MELEGARVIPNVSQELCEGAIVLLGLILVRFPSASLTFLLLYALSLLQ